MSCLHKYDLFTCTIIAHCFVIVDGPAIQLLSRSVVVLHSIAIHIDVLSEGPKLEY